MLMPPHILNINGLIVLTATSFSSYAVSMYTDETFLGVMPAEPEPWIRKAAVDDTMGDADEVLVTVRKTEFLREFFERAWPV